MKNKTVPEIRHKNIDDEWNLIKLSDLMNFSNGINAPKESYGRGRKMISVMDILSEERIEYKKIRNSVEVKESIESKNKVENGDLIFVRSSEVRNEVGWAKAYLQEQYALHSGFTIRGKKQNEYDAKFIECSLNFRNRYQIESKAGGSTRYNVGQEILKNVEIYIPPLKEQLLISTLIQNIENKINLHQQELDVLKKTKQGFLQKMFPGKGKIVPEVRFSGYTHIWEKKDIGEVFDTITDYVANGSFKSLRENVNSYESDNYAYLVRLQDASNQWRGPWLYTDEESYNFLKKTALYPNDIIMSNVGSVGKFFLVPYLDKPMTLAPNAMLIRSSVNDNHFIYQMMLTKNMQANILEKTTPGVQSKINKTDFKKIETYVPDVEEQTKIGKFFKQLDEVIELKEQELVALKQTKKGFLQKMFI